MAGQGPGRGSQDAPEAPAHLNRFFPRRVDLVHHHRGIIVDFLGGFFAPRERPRAEARGRACSCSRALQAPMWEVNAWGPPGAIRL